MSHSNACNDRILLCHTIMNHTKKKRYPKMSGKTLRVIAPARYIRASGYLQKTKRRRSGATTRFFVLTHHGIYYFKKTVTFVRRSDSLLCFDTHNIFPFHSSLIQRRRKKYISLTHMYIHTYRIIFSVRSSAPTTTEQRRKKIPV